MYETFEDTNGVIRTRKSKGRRHNDQKKKEKQWSTKPALYRNQRKKNMNTTKNPGCELRCPGTVSSSCYSCNYLECMFCLLWCDDECIDNI